MKKLIFIFLFIALTACNAIENLPEISIPTPPSRQTEPVPAEETEPEPEADPEPEPVTTSYYVTIETYGEGVLEYGSGEYEVGDTVSILISGLSSRNYLINKPLSVVDGAISWDYPFVTVTDPVQYLTYIFTMPAEDVSLELYYSEPQN